MLALPPKNLLLAVLIIASALGIAVETVRHARRRADLPTPPLRNVAPVAMTTFEQTRALFSVAAIPDLNTRTNSPHPFFTTYFQPTPQTPKATRLVELTYQGLFQTADGQKHAYITIGTNLVVGPVGTRIAGNLSVAAIDRPAVTLSLSETQMTVLAFRARTNVTVTLE